MPRTPDRFPGPLVEEEVQLEEQTEDPANPGYIRYVNGSFRFYDSSGIYDPRSGTASATAMGQILVSLDGSTFEVASPLVSDLGGMLTNGDGHMVVQG